MSDGAQAEYSAADTGVELPSSGDAAFAALMGVLVADEDGQETSEGGSPAGTPTAGDLASAPAHQGTGAPAGEPAAPPAGDAGSGAVAPDGAAGAADSSAALATDGAGTGGGLDAATLAPKWGEVKTGLETRHAKEVESAAIAEVREEFGKYFEAVSQHPRSLVGAEVPSITNPGQMEQLRDSADAKEWQEAVKYSLSQEVKDRADRKTDDLRGTMATLTASVAVFENNPDLIPGTKQFDRTFADRVAKTLAPYAVKVDGKAVGWSIETQPLIDSLRETMKAAAPAAAPATPAAPTPAQQRAAEQARDQAGRFDAPQAGIPSKSGNSAGEAEDFSTLFGTIGLPGLRI